MNLEKYKHSMLEKLKNSSMLIWRSSDLVQRPHPGIYYGLYPVKHQVGETALDKWLEDFYRRAREWLPVDRRRQKAFIAAVKIAGKNLEKMNDRVIDAWVLDLKKKLYSRGLREDLMVNAFAGIQEISKRELGKAHFDCQLAGGWTMMQGKIAEMQTGEGKTLTATLAAACAAMAGIPVHVITVNDYLVKRDLELMNPLYQRLGLRAGCITAELDESQRREVYKNSIVYCTGQQLVFDYLKDRLQLKLVDSDIELRLSAMYAPVDISSKLLLPGLNFAIVDEADSILIDEARTPLILSRKTDNSLQESVHREAIWLARELKPDRDYLCDEKKRLVELSHEGESSLETLAADMPSIWKGRRRRAALIKQALTALYLYRRDIDYIVLDGKVVIVDENTGRMMPDRSWEAGLHQMIEEKEGCEQSGINETIARISYQRFFSRYHLLAGMTGTASEVQRELSRVYGVSTLKIETNKPSRRIAFPAQVYHSQAAKWQAVANNAKLVHAQSRPVLIGTRTVEDSESISVLLTTMGLDHQVLNARQDAEEAKIITAAGQASQITVATNMAGRGTDIPLSAEARAAGGLHVICCEKNISSRIDRQLIGRCARQGDPGSYIVILSSDDSIASRYFSPVMLLLAKYVAPGGMLKWQWLALNFIKLSQTITEIGYRRARKTMMKADQQRDAMMAFGGKGE